MVELKLPTRVGRVGWDEHRFFGRAVFADLSRTSTFVELYALASGVALGAREIRLLDAAAAVLTAADPRVPPLLVSRIVASEGRSLSGVCAGLLACEGGRIGPFGIVNAAEVLLELESVGNEAIDWRWLQTRKGAPDGVPGFGAPFREFDERVQPFVDAVTAHGHEGTYWQQALELWNEAPRRLGLPANIGVMIGAVLLDLGFRGQGLVQISTLLLLHPFAANALEGAEQQAEVLRRLPDEYVEYKGVPPRVSPRAMAARAKAGAAGDAAPDDQSSSS